MQCSDLQFDLSLYADGMLDQGKAAQTAQHLETCPVCRQAYADIREIRAGLREIARPALSSFAVDSIKAAVNRELRTETTSLLPVSRSLREWLQLSLMPYGVGALASIVIGISFLSLMFSGNLRSGPFAVPKDSREPSALLASNSHLPGNINQSDISQTDYARERMAFASESPSVNPQGTLVALTRSFVRDGMKNDEVVVVADVFSNGLAQIAEVVEPSRDRKAVGELQKALDSDPAYAPFVPADMENRPDNVRVVLKFQSVNVSMKAARPRRSL